MRFYDREVKREREREERERDVTKSTTQLSETIKVNREDSVSERSDTKPGIFLETLSKEQGVGITYRSEQIER